MNRNRWALALAAVIALAAMLALGVAVSADDTEVQPGVEDLGSAALGDGSVFERFGARLPEMAAGMWGAGDLIAGMGGGRHGHPGWGDGADLETIADLLGMTADELRDALGEGKSLADIAEAQGVSLDDLQNGILERAKEKLDQAVADGRMDQERADEMLARLQENISDLLTKTFPMFDGDMGPGHRGSRGDFGGFGAGIEDIATILGMTADELRTALADGKTLADLAGEKNISLDELEASILDLAKENLDQAVADGRMDQERADEMLARLQENISDLLTKTFPAFEGGMGPGGRGGPGGWGGRGGHGGHGEGGPCGEPDTDSDTSTDNSAETTSA